MATDPTSNSFRAAVLRGQRRTLVVTQKTRRGSSEALDGAAVPRSETRRGDHRDQDRHRLAAETATARYKGKSHPVEVINLSAGGAMIRAEFAPRLWDLVELELGEGSVVEGAVRWLREDRVGIEFAHETRIDCDPDARAALLLEVIRRSFPDLDVQLARTQPPQDNSSPADEDLGNRAERRHPLIWKGEIHFAFDSNPVRLRNISPGGALVDIATTYPVGAEVLLDLGDAGQFHATVCWAYGDQAGLRFAKAFDIACLANARPDLTPHRWDRPSFLNPDVDEPSPWDERWTRSSLAELRSELEGFLKR